MREKIELSDLSAEDRQEIVKLKAMIKRRAEFPDEPLTHSYAEVYGEVVYEAGDE